MSHIKNITINNFRCFENFKIDSFKNINLIVGKNNSGKTCLLESLFMISGGVNPLSPAMLNNTRGLSSSAKNLKYIFYNCKLDNEASFTAQFNDYSNNELKISPVYTTIDIDKKTVTSSISSSISKNLTGLNLIFSVTTEQTEQTYNASYIVSDNGEQKTTFEQYQNKITASFITANSLETQTSLYGYGELVKKKKSEDILKIVQKIEPKILKIHSLPDGLFFDYENIDELIPCNIAGNGVRRIFDIITHIASESGNIILIDEIENGLHYSAHSALWKSIFSICNSLNVQLFITTHNIETLSSLKDTLELNKYQDMQDEVAVFNLVDTQKQGLKAYCYSFEGIKEAIELNQEMRY